MNMELTDFKELCERLVDWCNECSSIDNEGSIDIPSEMRELVSLLAQNNEEN